MKLTILAFLFALPVFQSTAPVIPAIDELEKARIDLVKLSQARANEACAGLDVFKDYSTRLRDTTTWFESRHPGFTINWTTDKAVAKGKPQ